MSRTVETIAISFLASLNVSKGETLKTSELGNRLRQYVRENSNFERDKQEMRELFCSVKQYWLSRKYVTTDKGKHMIRVLKVPKSKNDRNHKESKKKKVAPSRVCRFYTMGNCKFGVKCRFLHIDSEDDLFFEDEEYVVVSHFP